MSLASEATRAFQFVGARLLNAYYDGLSLLRQRKVREMFKNERRKLLFTPEEQADDAIKKTSAIFAHIINKHISAGQKVAVSEVQKRVRHGLKDGLLKSYGKAVCLRPQRVRRFLEELGVPEQLDARFIDQAHKHGLIFEASSVAQPIENFESTLREHDGRFFLQRTYITIAEDGRFLRLTRIVDYERSKPADDSPTVLLIPGIAAIHRCFDLLRWNSPALEMARRGWWVYLFDPRGMGENSSEFDTSCYIDTLIEYDVPAVVEFIHRRSSGRKVVLVGHSMGGMEAEFFVVKVANDLQEAWTNLVNEASVAGVSIPELTDRSIASIEGRLRQAVEEIKRKPLSEDNKDDLWTIVHDIEDCLSKLKMVASVVTFGTPKLFDKQSHVLYPLLLMLNHLVPMMGIDRVPVDEVGAAFRFFPAISKFYKHNVLNLNAMVNPENFDDSGAFMKDFITHGTQSFPLGVGLQLLKAIYGGKGIKMMTHGGFNYTANLHLVPPEVPVFHFYGGSELLAAMFNAALIDRSYYRGDKFNFDAFRQYSHKLRRVFRFSNGADAVDGLEFGPDQALAFVVDGIRHIDYFYGRRAEEVVKPLLYRIVEGTGTTR